MTRQLFLLHIFAIITLIISTSNAIPSVTTVVDCPSTSEKCVCNDDYSTSVQQLTCRNLSAFPELRGSHDYWTTVVSNSDVPDIYGNTFTFLKRRAMVIQANPGLRNIRNFAFSWGKFDQILIRQNPNLEEIEPLTFSNVQPSSNHIPPCKMLHNEANLGSCEPSIIVSGIQQFLFINELTFARASHIQYLKLDNIFQLKLTKHAFRSLSKLQVLIISHVKNFEYESGAFVGLPQLQHVTVSNAAITRIPQELACGSTEIRFLNLNNNQLTEATINESCLLSYVDTKADPEDGLKSEPCLLEWALSSFTFTNLPSERNRSHVSVFSLKQLVSIDITGNNLSTVPEWMQQLPLNAEVNFRENPIVCDCKLHWMRLLSKQNRHRFKGLPLCVEKIAALKTCQQSLIIAFKLSRNDSPQSSYLCIVTIVGIALLQMATIFSLHSQVYN